MVVRHPVARLLSMFWFTEKASGPASPLLWLDLFFTKRRMWTTDVADSEWYCTQSEMAEAFQPDKILRLEDGLAAVCAEVGVRAEEVRAWVTPAYPSFRETFVGMNVEQQTLVDEFVGEDLRRWYGQ